MDPTQVVRDENGVMRCRQCGFPYALSPEELAQLDALLRKLIP